LLLLLVVLSIEILKIFDDVMDIPLSLQGITSFAFNFRLLREVSFKFAPSNRVKFWVSNVKKLKQCQLCVFVERLREEKFMVHAKL
jgi:hypothetical protein